MYFSFSEDTSSVIVGSSSGSSLTKVCGPLNIVHLYFHRSVRELCCQLNWSHVFQASDLSSRFDIPIFTEEFLDQNKGNRNSLLSLIQNINANILYLNCSKATNSTISCQTFRLTLVVVF